jgi:hypothetical protein
MKLGHRASAFIFERLPNLLFTQNTFNFFCHNREVKAFDLCLLDTALRTWAKVTNNGIGHIARRREYTSRYGSINDERNNEAICTE